ncbi:ALP1-like protein isoform X1 [Tanacetum coccineum]
MDGGIGIRELRGRGLGDFEELMVLINFFFPNMLQEDSWRWIHDDDGAFTVKKLRDLVDDKILNRTIGAQETKWCKIVPRKVCIFIWRLQRRRLPVYIWLDRLGMDVNSILCPHCGMVLKTVVNAFLAVLSGVIEFLGREYLRKPTVTDAEKLYVFHEQKHVLPRMLCCLDCTVWEWFGCPTAYKGKSCRRGHCSNPFILLEVVASQDLWI